MAGTSEIGGEELTSSGGTSSENVTDKDEYTTATNSASNNEDCGDAAHAATNNSQDVEEEDQRTFNMEEDENDEKKKQEECEKELEKRREREAAMSEEELNNLREEARTLKAVGNDHFGTGFWNEAAKYYTQALDVCPLVYTSDRATYLSNRAAAHIKISDWEKAIEDCTEALELGAPNEKPLERRAYSCSQIPEKYEKAIEDYESLLKMHPDRKRMYGEKIYNLKRGIEQRNEKMKEDMITKLKDLGNMCLKPFGLSTDNFELSQQPGGGYSISMKK